MDMVGVRTMEFARRWGIADWVEQSPYPRDYPQDNVYLESLNGFEFGREVMPSKDDEPRPHQSPQKRERCPQDMFDPILQRFVGQFPAASVAYRTELVAFEEQEDRVVATLRDLESGATREATADYLVGTDGGASFVRETLGIGMSGQPVLTYTTNVIFRCANFSSLHDKGKAYRFIFIGPEGTWLTIVAINGKDRWRMSVIGNESKQQVDEAEIRALIFRAMGKEFDFEIESVLPWVRRELIAESYASQRVFLAGDSAHLMSPTGGFGMNTGIGDATDLAWKLDAMAKGWGGPQLLRSYQAERLPVAKRSVAEASANLRLMLKPRTTPPPSEIFMPGVEHDAARKAYGSWYGDLMKREWFAIGIHLGYRYDDSPIIIPDGSPPPRDEAASYEQTSRPGARAPHAWLSDGRSTLDLFGKGFVLLRLKGNEDDGDWEDAAIDLGIPFKTVTIDEPDVSRAYEDFALVLVRPDGHVAWRGMDHPANARAILDRVRGG
jgi:2-polyprenyl-6-methoxyphenol hydroxylase-like FAD-dependent oxidoreductase